MAGLRDRIERDEAKRRERRAWAHYLMHHHACATCRDDYDVRCEPGVCLWEAWNAALNQLVVPIKALRARLSMAAGTRHVGGPDDGEPHA